MCSRGGSYCVCIEYANVKNSHIVPRSYLAQFADAVDRVSVHLVRERRELVSPIDKVGTRRRYYRRLRPDGSPIDDIEWSLSQAEQGAAPILHEFARGASTPEWPFPLEKKAELALLFAFQILRGPRWAAWREKTTRQHLADERQAGATPPEVIDDVERHLLSDSERLMQMMRMVSRVSTVVGSMHWTLLKFGRPLLATSDHPVVLWPAVAAQPPQPTPASVGILETLEIRIPVSPRHLILMTWSDARDKDYCLVKGQRHHAANANAFTVAEADRQWFHSPGPCPPRASGRLTPLSRELVRAYDMHAAAHSARRKRVSDHVQPTIGTREIAKDFTLFSVD